MARYRYHNETLQGEELEGYDVDMEDNLEGVGAMPTTRASIAMARLRGLGAAPPPAPDEQTQLINSLTSFQVMGVHPINQAQATDLVTKFSAVVESKARAGVIPLVVGGVLAAIILLKKR